MNTYNGMPATDLAEARWRKSSISNSQGACVELARLTGGEFAVRNSRTILNAGDASFLSNTVTTTSRSLIVVADFRISSAVRRRLTPMENPTAGVFWPVKRATRSS